MTSFNTQITLSIETTAGQSFQHGFHLGTMLPLAKQIAEEKFHARVANNLPIYTVALLRAGKMLGCYDGKEWM